MGRVGPRRRGVAIVTVLLVLSILVVVGLGIASMGAGQMALANSQTFSEKAYMAADAAASMALDNVTQGTATGGTVIAMAPMDAANSPDVAMGAKVFANNCTVVPATGPNTTVTLPNGSSFALPNQHYYILGQGTAANSTLNPVTRFVGVMVERVPPGGIWYFGAYGATGLDASSNTGSTDAWDPSANAYSTSKRIPFADLEGSGGLTNVAGQNIWGNVDGPTVKALGTNFNSYGIARQPGTALQMPPVNWPAAAPSPGAVDINQSSGQDTLTKWDVSDVKQVNVTGGNLILKGEPGGVNFTFTNLTVGATGDIIIDDSNGPVNIYVTNNGNGANVNFYGNGSIVPKNSNGSANSTQIFTNGTAVNIIENATTTMALVNPNGSSSILINGTSNVFGSVTGNHTVTIKDTASVHYDVTLRPTNSGYSPALPQVSVISHQRL